MQSGKQLFTLHRIPQRLALLLCLCGFLAAQSGGVWVDVPFIAQEKNGCGSAVIAMVMQYWQNKGPQHRADAINAADIQQALYSRRSHGIHASDLERYFNEHGFRAFSLKGDWNLLRAHLEKGRPLIVALKPARGENSLHYVVVVGLDWQDNLLLLNDPAQKKSLKVERQQFEREWSRLGNWTLLAVPN